MIFQIKNLIKKFERTKNRPIASEKISIKLRFILYFAILCFCALLVLIEF